MDQSILNNIKKLLGIDSSYTQFDPDIIMHINAILVTLNQIGVGKEKFMIEDSKAIWSDFLQPEFNLSMVQPYVYLQVKLLFDPPLNQSAITAMKESIAQLEWRLQLIVEPLENVEEESTS